MQHNYGFTRTVMTRSVFRATGVPVNPPSLIYHVGNREREPGKKSRPGEPLKNKQLRPLV